MKDTRYFPIEKYRRRGKRKINTHLASIYPSIATAIPTLTRAVPLTLHLYFPTSPSLSLVSVSFPLTSILFLFLFHIDTKLSPPVNKYRQQWRPKGGSFSYFNVLGTPPPLLSLPAVFLLLSIPFCTLRVYGPVQGFKTIFAAVYTFFPSSSRFFLSFLPIRKFRAVFFFRSTPTHT